MHHFYLFPSPTLLRVTGKDAERYLNARLTNNIVLLEPGSLCEAAALNAQGKTEGLFFVLRTGKESFLLACTGGENAEIQQALGRFIVADQLEISDIHADHLLLNLCEPTPPAELDVEPGQFLQNDDRFIWKSFYGSPGSYYILCAKAESETLLSQTTGRGLSQLDHEQWLQYRHQAGLLSYPEELNDTILFTEAGLRHAVSFTKGCYVGQEVIEKVDAIGKLPRKIVKVSIAGCVALNPGAAVFSDERKIGAVLSSSTFADRDKTLAFCIVKNIEPVPESLSIDSYSATFEPM